MEIELHPYGPLSLLPPVAAITLAVLTRRLVPSMLVGIYIGALLTTGGRPLAALSDFWEIHLWRTLIDPQRLRIYSFTILMGGLIGVITRSGGMHGLLSLVMPWARSRRRGQLTAWLAGLLVFFDDYANTLLLGTTLRPVTDRLRISREKLAYIVDSTAAPVAGLSLISTWVAVEIDYVRSGLINVEAALEESAVSVFLASLPYRFYLWFALLMVPLTAILGRDFGAMRRAELDRWQRDAVDDRHPRVDELQQSIVASAWYNAVLPIAATVLMVIYFIYSSGVQKAGAGADLNQILYHSDPALALQYGAFGGWLLAVLLARTQRLLDQSAILAASAAGVRLVAPAIAILWCASALSAMTSNQSVDGVQSQRFEFRDHRLYTGDYLKSVLVTRPATAAPDGSPVAADPLPATDTAQPRFPLPLLPTVVFVLAGLVAFCTGTSWGTMGILMPIVVPMTYALIGTESVQDILHHPLMLGSIAGVMSGAIFGDHCSPISDTTVLSAQCCSCELIAHVTTQLPYALSVAAINILLGTLPMGLGVSVWMLLPLQLLGLVLVVLVIGRRVEC